MNAPLPPPERADPLIGASKLPRVGTTVFTVMSALAAQHRAVNLGQGFPDFDCDPRLQALLTEAMAAAHNQYAPMGGVPALRERIAAKMARAHGHRYDVDAEITVTAGATQAIMCAILALVRTGDEVIVFEPVYDSYVPSIELAGGRAVPIPLDAARGFAPDWDRVRDALTPRTRMVVLNFPHNPSGRILHPADLDALRELAARTDALFLSDEVYEHIVFDGQPHRSLAGVPELAGRTVVISSFGKTFHTTGWKLGYAMAPRALMAEFRKVHQFMVFAVNTPGQHAMARWLEDPAHHDELPAFYQRKRDRFVAGLAGSRFRLLPCEGTYFVLADYSAISDAPEADFARTMIVEHGVAVIPVSAFHDPPVDRRLVRFCFAKKDETLDAAIERLRRV